MDARTTRTRRKKHLSDLDGISSKVATGVCVFEAHSSPRNPTERVQEGTVKRRYYSYSIAFNCHEAVQSSAMPRHIR